VRHRSQAARYAGEAAAEPSPKEKWRELSAHWMLELARKKLNIAPC
jgi:hypothetical protein